MESYLPSFILMSSFLLNNSLWFSVLASSARISVRINAPDISSSRIMITNFHQIIFKIISVACDQDNCQDKTVWSIGLFSLSDSLLAPVSSVAGLWSCSSSADCHKLCLIIVQNTHYHHQIHVAETPVTLTFTISLLTQQIIISPLPPFTISDHSILSRSNLKYSLDATQYNVQSQLLMIFLRIDN